MLPELTTGNPFNEERQENLRAQATEFISELGGYYKQAYTRYLLDKIQAGIKKKKEPKRTKLTPRPPKKAKKIERAQLFSGELYLKEGEGVGSFEKWNHVWLAERDDYQLDVYSSKQSQETGGQPTATIEVAGYQIQKNLTDYYADQLEELREPLDLGDRTESETFHSLSFALIHSTRTNYVMQTQPPPPEPGCCPCFGGSAPEEPEEEVVGTHKPTEDWIKKIQKCIDKRKARDLSTVHGKAFDKAVKQITAAREGLHGHKFDGSEAQILVDMLMVLVVTSLRDEMMGEVTIPGNMKLALWYKARAAIVSFLTQAVETAWTEITDGINQGTDALVEQINSMIEEIQQAKEQLHDQIRATISDQLSQLMSEYLTPFLTPVVNAFEKPVRQAYINSRKLFEREMTKQLEVGLNPDETMRNRSLDQIPRDRKLTRDVSKACDKLVEPLRNLAELDERIFGSLDIDKYRQDTEEQILTTLDSAVYTFEVKLKKSSLEEAKPVYEQVCKFYKHDIPLGRATCVITVVRAIFYDKIVKQLDSLVGEEVDRLDEMIPEPLKEFVSVRANYEEVIELIIGEPIDETVEGVFGVNRNSEAA